MDARPRTPAYLPPRNVLNIRALLPPPHPPPPATRSIAPSHAENHLPPHLPHRARERAPTWPTLLQAYSPALTHYAPLPATTTIHTLTTLYLLPPAYCLPHPLTSPLPPWVQFTGFHGCTHSVKVKRGRRYVLMNCEKVGKQQSRVPVVLCGRAIPLTVE